MSGLMKSRVATILQVLAKRLIINSKEELIDHELNSPFVYLHSLSGGVFTLINGKTRETENLLSKLRFEGQENVKNLSTNTRQ